MQLKQTHTQTWTDCPGLLTINIFCDLLIFFFFVTVKDNGPIHLELNNPLTHCFLEDWSQLPLELTGQTNWGRFVRLVLSLIQLSHGLNHNPKQVESSFLRLQSRIRLPAAVQDCVEICSWDEELTEKEADFCSVIYCHKIYMVLLYWCPFIHPALTC